MWIGLTGIAAVLVGTVHAPLVFLLAMTMWGFSFWMGIPGAFSLLAERSNFPDERAGDAQAIMAVGRVIGPLVGGALYEISPSALGAGAGAIMITAAALLVYVEWRIRPHVIANLVGV